VSPAPLHAPRPPRLRFAGDALLLLEFEARIAPDINARAIAVAEALAGSHLAGVRDVVPSYCSVGIHIDPLTADLPAIERAVAAALGRLAHAADGPPRPGAAGTPGRVVEIPVCYGGVHGPDLARVAAFAGCSEDEVIARHLARTYRVYMLGFVPGFAYMASVDRSIAVPRHRVPRERVPAGSVGIAGEQTGVYPRETPGGWHLIGRTAVTMFDVAREPASLVAAGDQVRFVRLDAAAFEAGTGGPRP
jgi:KipI family sensor histidine kinase inhibitor